MIMVPGDRVRRAISSFLEHGYEHDSRTPRAARRPWPRCMTRATSSSSDYILRALAKQQGNMSRTAEVLGVERSNLYRKMRAFGIMPTRRGDDEDVA